MTKNIIKYASALLFVCIATFFLLYSMHTALAVQDAKESVEGAKKLKAEGMSMAEAMVTTNSSKKSLHASLAVLSSFTSSADIFPTKYESHSVAMLRASAKNGLDIFAAKPLTNFETLFITDEYRTGSGLEFQKALLTASVATPELLKEIDEKAAAFALGKEFPGMAHAEEAMRLFAEASTNSRK